MGALFNIQGGSVSDQFHHSVTWDQEVMRSLGTIQGKLDTLIENTKLTNKDYEDRIKSLEEKHSRLGQFIGIVAVIFGALGTYLGKIIHWPN